MKNGIMTAAMIFLSFVVAGPAAAGGSVARATFTSDVRDREPMDQVTALPSGAKEISFFTELVDLDGQTITHRWQRGGVTEAEMSFQVEGTRWRVWSSKDIDSGTSGEWTVIVVDGSGQELSRTTLTVQ